MILSTLQDSGKIITEVYKDIEIKVYPAYQKYGYENSDQIHFGCEHRYYYGFLAEVKLIGTPEFSPNTEIKIIFEKAKSTHIRAFNLAKKLIDELPYIKLFDEWYKLFNEYESLIKIGSFYYDLRFKKIDTTAVTSVYYNFYSTGA